MTLWLISDTHFSHENIITYCKRPFASAEEMDEVLVQNWNKVVKPSDHVYHLGDVALRKQQLAIVSRLNGKKRLLLGNHDIFDVKDYLKAGFQKVMAYRVLDGCLLSHIPVHPGSMGRFRANIHGHIHERNYEFPYINTSVEQIDYTPVALETITKDLPPQRSREEVFDATCDL
jgi:calcineurin-like phosphoesterase family protein